MLNKIKEIVLNTPEKYWLIVFGYHIHKSFWGLILFIAGLIISVFYSLILGIILLVIGIIIMILAILGNLYTHNKAYFKLWDKYK